MRAYYINGHDPAIKTLMRIKYSSMKNIGKLMKIYVALISMLGLFMPILPALAQGNFDYLTVRGPGVTGEINITNIDLTGDYFAFADFSKGSIDPPTDPGQGYEIVRVHVITENEKPEPTPFDQLHYYPYTGYVFYDGLVNGSSEHDGKWYAANPSANEPFRAALAARARLTWIPFAVFLVIIVVFAIAYYKKPKEA